MDKPAKIVGIISGKGGVGKSNLAANLAVACSGLGARVLVVDGDLGLANLDVLLGVSSHYSVVDVLRQERSLEDAVTRGPRGIDLLPAASGRGDLASLEPSELAPMLIALFQATERYDIIFIDLAAGLAPTVISLAAACDQLLLVSTPEPTSLADAYATLKTMERETPGARIELVVNQARTEQDARATHDRLERLARRFLNRELPLLGCVPEDPLLVEAVSRQRTLIETHPRSPAGREIIRIADRLWRGRGGMRSASTSAGPAQGAWRGI